MLQRLSLPARPSVPWASLALFLLAVNPSAWARHHHHHRKGLVAAEQEGGPPPSRHHRHHHHRRADAAIAGDRQRPSGPPVIVARGPRPRHEPCPTGELPGGGVGWGDAGRRGWNAREAQVGAIRRIPLDGLRTINWNPATDPALPWLERADHRAVVLVHRDLDPRRPVDVLIHLHGFDPGYRQCAVLGRGASVRDVDHHRIEEQLEEVGDPQLVALLPQGSLDSSFSPVRPPRLTKAFDNGAFVDEVLQRLDDARLVWPRPVVRRVVLSAHSGGGEALGVMLGSSEPRAPLAMVVLFDAINGPREELPRVERWLAGRLRGELLRLHGLDPEEQRRYLATSLRFRAYYTQSGTYMPLHNDPGAVLWGAAPGLRPLAQFLDEWLATHKDELGGTEGVAYQGLRDNYQVIPVPEAGHSSMIGAGRLHEALRALPPEVRAPDVAAAAPPPGSTPSIGRF